jgi:hypothetical protein
MKMKRENTSARKTRIVNLAKLQCHRDGECEIDDTAAVSEGNENGAYVQAWVWVDFDGTDLDKEAIPTSRSRQFAGGLDTAAGEDSRVAQDKSQGLCAWNNSGFGLKDPGKGRDGYKPSWFDQAYPIDGNCPCKGVSDAATVGELLARLKDQLSYPVRYDIRRKDAAKPINLRGVAKTAEGLLVHVARTLGNSWQLMRFKSHFTLYQQQQPKNYAHGVQLHP